MNTTKPILVMLSLLLVLGQATMFAQQKQDDDALNAIREKVSSINAEIKAVQAQLESLETTRVELVTEERGLAVISNQLKIDREELHRGGEAFRVEAMNQNVAGRKLAENPPDRSNAAAVAAWNAEATRLNAWGDRIDEQKKERLRKSDQIIQGQKYLSDATLANFAQKKTNNVAIEDAQVQRNKLVREVRSLMLDDSFLDDLRKRNLLSQEAVKEMRKRAWSMTELDSSLEIAHRLLQQVWDGAAPKKH
jgi:hypothetical protein